MGGMDYDVERVRASFPALGDGTAYFDGPGGSQVPRQVARGDRVHDDRGLSNRGTVTAAERRAEDVVVGARAAMADLLGCDAGGVVFGRSMTQLTFDLARALAKTWEPGDEVVVTRLDHDANIRPWLRAADAARRDRALGRLRHRDRASCSSTRACCRSGPGWSRSPAPPTCSAPVPTSPAIAAAVHAAGALLFVDGVHLTPHAPVGVRRPRRGLLRLLALQVLRPAPRRARRRPDPARAACSRTSCCPRPTRCPSGSSSARCPTSCSPA